MSEGENAAIPTDWTPLAPLPPETRLIFAISTSLQTSSPLDISCFKLLNILSSQTHFPFAAIEAYDLETKEMTLMDTIGSDGVSNVSAPFRTALPTSVILSGAPWADPDVSRRQDYQFPSLRPLNIKSFICVPLRVADKILGCISLADTRVRENLLTWIPIIQIIAHLLAYKLEDSLNEISLNKNKKLLQQSQKMGNVGHWTWNTRTNTVVWSEEMKLIFGINPEIWKGNLDEIIKNSIHPDDIKRVNARNQAVITAGEPAEMEYRILRPDGSTRWVSASPIEKTLDKKGNVTMLSGIIRDITEQKNSAAYLQQSEKKYRMLFESMYQGIIFQSPNGRLTEANSAASRILGLNTGEISERTHSDFQWHAIREDGSDFPAVEHPIAVALETGQPVYNVIMGVYNPEKKHHVWIRINAAPCIHRHDDVSLGACAVFDDITEQKIIQDALKESEKRYRELFENINSGVAVYKPVNGGQDFIFTDFNRAGERIDNEKRENLIGESVLKVRPGITASGLLDVFRRVCRTGIPESFPIMFYQDKRLSGWYENFVYKLPSGDIVAVFDNVTSKKQAEETLRLSEQKYRLLAENVDDAILAFDMQKNLLYASPSIVKLTGYTIKAISSGNFLPWLHPGDYHRMMNLWMETFSGKSFSNVETRIITANGQEKWILSSWGPLPDEQGRQIGIQGSERDITILKHIQHQLEIALNEKETLLRELYHRTKNNMQVIQSLLNLQRAQSGNRELNSVILDINNRISAMSLVHQMLCQSGDLSHIQLHEYVRELAALMIRSFNINGDKISLEFDLEPVEITIDAANPCGLILNELISNSLKHAFPDNQHGRISIRLRREESGWVRIEFADNGQGFPPDCDPRAKTTLGIRSAIALAEHQLRGDIRFTSENGLTITLRFPNHTSQR